MSAATLVAVAGAGLLGSCAPACLPAVGVGDPASSPRCPQTIYEDGSSVVVAVEGESLGCDIPAEATYVIRYPGSDGIEEAKFLARCDDDGGRLVWTAEFDEYGEFVCWGADF